MAYILILISQFIVDSSVTNIHNYINYKNSECKNLILNIDSINDKLIVEKYNGNRIIKNYDFECAKLGNKVIVYSVNNNKIYEIDELGNKIEEIKINFRDLKSDVKFNFDKLNDVLYIYDDYTLIEFKKDSLGEIEKKDLSNEYLLMKNLIKDYSLFRITKEYSIYVGDAGRVFCIANNYTHKKSFVNKIYLSNIFRHNNDIYSIGEDLIFSGVDSKMFDKVEFAKLSNIYKFGGDTLFSIFNQTIYLNESDWQFDFYIDYTIINEELMYIMIKTIENYEVSISNKFEIKGSILLFNYIEKKIIKNEKFNLTEDNYIYE